MKTIAKVAIVAAVQAVLVGAAVAPQLSARLTGDTYQLRVAPLDPIDPFRGAYVTLDYPDLRHDDSWSDGGGMGAMDDGESGRVFITLTEEGGVMVADEFLRDRPDEGPYLACDDSDWQIRCGIDSFFLPQDKAADMEAQLVDGAVAEVRIDGRGNAALIDVRDP
ncbi:GDYXXLXY domain-containing protein [Nocardioides piscis]|uniref:GDYXXLXY domain-containing protein n=1 Tax=Nocardioides piscis TaxID=2714938 RepID=A0A6G7YFF3_9ACTN|nr:GDYXXLXY domain-containing protein [Nocardioides piscis]QIK75337.1 GDYXXLXY domain-containing protein [Nocardioides piscis]